MNTRIIPVEYNFVAPQTLAEALDILAKKKDVKVLAGGTDVIVELKCGANVKINTLMDIKNIQELEGIKACEKGVVIGATTKLSDIEDNEVIAGQYKGLQEALKAMAAIAVRHMGTIGGNFVNASPVADTAGPVMVFGGQVKLVSKKGERLVDAKEFFLAPGKSAREADELVKEFLIPAPAKNSGSAFIKKTRVKADISKVSTSVFITRDGDKIVDFKIAMGAVAAKPILLEELAAKYVGQNGNAATFATIAKEVADTIKPITDPRSTADYRKAVAEVIVNDALVLAWDRAGGVK